MPLIPSKLSSLVKARYQVRDNAFIRAAKDDPRDRIDIEIGDEKQPSTFYPQVKLKRWDNEINLSVRLKDDDYDAPTIQTSQDKIKWISGKREAHFYEIGASQDHPEGGYEFEVVLKEKPTTNVVEFSIQTKGLEFLYQPALTPTEIERGCARPENVVGSYAVYYKDCPANYEGGKLYRVGKAFHIYRPKIEDAKGNWTWGELRVNEEQGTLAVTIPWEFLDEAVYPVRHAAGLTFGYETLGASLGSLANILCGSLFTSPSGIGQIDSMTLGVKNTSVGSYVYKAIIVLHSDLGIIANGISNEATYSSTTTGWITPTFATLPTLSATTDYVLGAIGGIRTAFCYDTGDANQGHYDTTNNYTTPTDPTDANHNTAKFSVYITYTASASGPANLKTFDGLAKSSVKTILGLAIASVKSVDGLT